MADAYGGTRKRLRGSEHLKDQDEEPAQKLQFVEPAVQGIYDGMPIDVDVVANDGRTLKAHRVALETRSPMLADRIKEVAYAWEVTKSPMFQAMFEAGQTIVLLTEAVKSPDLNHELLKFLLEFLHSAEVAFSKEYEDFSVKNAHLALEITKAFVRSAR